MDDILLTDGEIKSEVVAAFGHHPDDDEMRALRDLCCAQVRKVWKVIEPDLDYATEMFKDIRLDWSDPRYECKEGAGAIARVRRRFECK